ncbi:MAG: SDR family NAD(P)-dependent oxidoreductase [Acidimicrobiales bacterium]
MTEGGTVRAPSRWDLRSSIDGTGVLVTGATGGIGSAVVEGFAALGAHVVVADLDQSRCDEVVAGLRDPSHHLAAGVDLADLGSHDGLVQSAVDRFGRLDTLVHLAAVLRRRDSIDDVTEEDWDVQLDTNLKAAFFLNRAVARQMRSQGNGGSIVNFTSQGWWTGGFGGSVVYCASKGGIVSMSRGLARTLAPDRITVNSIAPGAIDTAMMRGGLTEDQLAAQIAPIPMGRMGEPDEMVGAVLYLASGLARYVTGATVNATGGWLMY